MRSKLYTYVVTLILFVGTAHIGYAQGGKEPPQPEVKSTPPLPPPVGLPTPIDDYIPYLLILGALAGASYFYKIERQEPTNS